MVQQNIALYANMGCPLKFYGRKIIPRSDVSLPLHQYVANYLRNESTYLNNLVINRIQNNDESIVLTLFTPKYSEIFHFLDNTQTVTDFLSQYENIIENSRYNILFKKIHIGG